MSSPESEHILRTVRALLHSKKAEDALRFCDGWIDRVSDDARYDVLGARADTKWVLGDRLAALEDLAIAKSLRPDKSGSRYQECVWLLELRRFPEAAEAAMQLIELEKSKNSERFIDSASFFCAYALVALDQFEDGLSLLRQVRDEKPFWVAGELISKADLLKRADAF